MLCPQCLCIWRHISPSFLRAGWASPHLTTSPRVFFCFSSSFPQLVSLVRCHRNTHTHTSDFTSHHPHDPLKPGANSQARMRQRGGKRNRKVTGGRPNEEDRRLTLNQRKQKSQSRKDKRGEGGCWEERRGEELVEKQDEKRQKGGEGMEPDNVAGKW